MKEERMEILTMLKEGKISAEEAERLLAALEAGEKEEKRRPYGHHTGHTHHTHRRTGPEDFGPFSEMARMFKGFGRAFGSTMKSAFGGGFPFSGFEQFMDDLDGMGYETVSQTAIDIGSPFTLVVRQTKNPNTDGDVEIVPSNDATLFFEADEDPVVRRKDNELIVILHDDCTIHVPDTCENLMVALFNGDIAINDISGKTDVHTMSGDIELERVVLNRTCSTLSGDIEATLCSVVESRAELTTLSGDIDLEIGKRTIATVTAETLSGDVDFDFPATITDKKTGPVGTRMTAKIGGGGEPALFCKTLSGDISISLDEDDEGSGENDSEQHDSIRLDVSEEEDFNADAE